jgi:hypothetical protein
MYKWIDAQLMKVWAPGTQFLLGYANISNHRNKFFGVRVERNDVTPQSNSSSLKTKRHGGE